MFECNKNGFSIWNVNIRIDYLYLSKQEQFIFAATDSAAGNTGNPISHAALASVSTLSHCVHISQDSYLKNLPAFISADKSSTSKMLEQQAKEV